MHRRSRSTSALYQQAGVINDRDVKSHFVGDLRPNLETASTKDPGTRLGDAARALVRLPTRDSEMCHHRWRIQGVFAYRRTMSNTKSSAEDFDGIDRFLWRAMQFSVSFNGGPPFEPGGYLTDYYTDQAVRVIEATRDRPFFLYFAHWAVHTPLQALKADYDALSHIEEHRLRVYAAMVRSLDRSVGRVLAALRDNGLEDDTLVFFTSDNGAPAYIGLPRVNEPFRRWKINFFEGGIHVPFFLKWPARLAGGQTFEAPVHGFDIFSTAAAAAGVELPRDRLIDGVDLVPFVAGEAAGAPHERLFWRTGGYQVVLADGYKLQVSDPPGKTWLFHLASDPTEQRNLAGAAPERVAALKQLPAEHNAEQAPPRWPSAVVSPINVDKTLLDPDAPDDEFIYWFN